MSGVTDRDGLADIRATLGRLEPMIARLDAALPYLATKEDVARVSAVLPSLASQADVATIEGRLDAALPALASKADVATKPNRGELWGAMAAGLALFAVILAGLSYLPHPFPSVGG